MRNTITRFAGLALFVLLITGCVSHPPRDVNNICNVFKEYPQWYWDAKDVERRWKVPLPVQMAIIHQESKFDGKARPPRKKICRIIPWTRPTTAYGYSQALNGTWAEYKREQGNFWCARDNFGHAVDFIGWYANVANRRAHIPRNDAYALYLAYHEGIGGYLRKSYLKKPWLIQVARKVKARSEIYQGQLQRCRLPRKSSLW